MDKNYKLAAVALGVLLVILAAWLLANQGDRDVIVAEFENSAGESILVSFDRESREAILDGAGYEDLVFTQAVSASGARYLNTEEGLELWNKGEGITLSKGTEVLFSGETFTLETGEDDSAESVVEDGLYVFAGPTWVWGETRMSDGKVVRPSKPGMYSIWFNSAEGKLEGKTDCNGFGGSYTAGTGNKLSFGPFMSTLMFCEGSLEAEFSKMVTDSNQYTFTPTGDLVLMLKFDSGSVIFKKKP